MMEEGRKRYEHNTGSHLLQLIGPGRESKLLLLPENKKFTKITFKTWFVCFSPVVAKKLLGRLS